MPALTEHNRIFIARDILGDCLVTPVEIRSAVPGVAYDHDQISGCRDTMPSPDVLQWCAENQYMLVAGPPKPLSLIDILHLWPDYFYSGPGACKFDPDDDPVASDDTAQFGWIGMRMGAVPGSMGKSKSAQCKLLDEVETVPNVAQALWATIVLQKVRKFELDLRIFVRTSSVNLDGNRVCIGGHGVRGQERIHFRPYGDDVALGTLGLAACLNRVVTTTIE